MVHSGLSLEQAPPAWVIAGFFVAGPSFVALAGALLLAAPERALITPWAPETLALAHLGTLGLLGMTMVGALYQLLPVVGGARVPMVGLGLVVALGLSLGVLGFFAAALLGRPTLLARGAELLVAALTLFVLPVGFTLARLRTPSPAVRGMQLALLCLVSTAALGFALSRGYGGASFAADRTARVAAHLTLGLVGWIGGLLVSVSWQLFPMFYLAPETPRLLRDATLVSLGALALGAPLAVGLVELIPSLDLGVLFALLAAPALLFVWLAHPIDLWLGARDRRRKRPDQTLSFWLLGALAAPLSLGLGAATVWSGDPRVALGFGWVAIFGWAGATAHGAAFRIVPFLVWLHRLSHFAGKTSVPSARQLLPDTRTRAGLWLHAATLGLGAAAIASSAASLTLATGVGLVATGSHWLYCVLDAARVGFTAERRARAALGSS